MKKSIKSKKQIYKKTKLNGGFNRLPQYVRQSIFRKYSKIKGP